MALFAAIGILSGCVHPRPHAQQAQDAASAAANIQAAWVEIGANGQAIARVVTQWDTAQGGDAACPLLHVDGSSARMSLRVAAGTMPLRPTASAAVDSKPSAFPVSVCEASLPTNAHQADVAGRPLPLPKAEPQRILVLADTGCRMKKADNVYQACNDLAAWPFATIVATAAGFEPDLVLHVGDYHYRENPCPSDIAGCRNSPWGYGWDTWQADFFTPAARLLSKAPWIVVRGNHEECKRAGQGWFRLLDPHPYAETRSCNNPVNDEQANYSEPYAVALGGGSQLIVFDSAKAHKTALEPGDAQFQIYQKQFQSVAALAAKPGISTTIFTNHHQILAFSPIAGTQMVPGTQSLQSVMRSLNGQAYYPQGIQVALHAHVHSFQAINFASDHPATIVSGNGGDNIEVALPDPLPTDAAPAPGTVIDKVAHHNSFGFMLMERRAAPASGWTFKAYTAAGKLLTTCVQNDRTLSCDKTGFIAP
ncbi:serine/threonine protein phosphatase [Dyella tabacisoli]|uniref:Serine/threonine protein phosphatase n=2 Tax=Dyella tabacisoli TaxID=2282381 RepID=A0A369US41_9GAMM|nr:serine/threonine protein phosphatase [Dyella tabacisoli]